jgi:hypothetical protein
MGLSYEQRVAKMKRPEDVVKQLRLAKNYAKSVKSKVRNAVRLESKISLQKEATVADAIVRKLQKNLFLLEDELAGKLEQAARAKSQKEKKVLETFNEKLKRSSHSPFAF